MRFSPLWDWFVFRFPLGVRSSWSFGTSRGAAGGFEATRGSENCGSTVSLGAFLSGSVAARAFRVSGSATTTCDLSLAAASSFSRWMAFSSFFFFFIFLAIALSSSIYNLYW